MTSVPLTLLLIITTFLHTAPAQQTAGDKPNLLTNASFEEGLTGWEFTATHSRGRVAVDPSQKRSGMSAVSIDNSIGDDSMLYQPVTVKPRTLYRLTGYIRTKAVFGRDTLSRGFGQVVVSSAVRKGAGACLALEGRPEETKGLGGKMSWTRVTLDFHSGAADTTKVVLRLGAAGAIVTGKAWFDDLTLVEVGPSRKP